MTWAWGDLWIIGCAIAAVVAAELEGDRPEGWVLCLVLLGLLGWLMLNVLQAQLGKVPPRPRVYDQEQDQ